MRCMRGTFKSCGKVVEVVLLRVRQELASYEARTVEVDQLASESIRRHPLVRLTTVRL